MITKNDLDKNKQREFSKIKRQNFNSVEANFEINLCKKINEIIEYKSAKIIASFISIKTEISTNFLNEVLQKTKKIICLPTIKKGTDHLIFRKFEKSSTLKEGQFGVLEPDLINKVLIPDLIFTPCLAFDKYGYRLGYGGGYYDKTFFKFKSLNHKFISVAVAYDDQRLDKVIHNKFDQKVNYVMTEKKLYKIK